VARRGGFVGKERVAARFAALKREVRQHLADAVRDNSEALAEAHRRLAPVESGKTVRSIKSEEVEGSQGRSYLNSAGADDKGGDDAFYARMVEFGTVKRPAHPWFYPTARAMRKQFKRRYRQGLRAAIKESRQ